MQTLDQYLRKISLKNKDVAVVGPNHSVWDDPSPVYFANRMANIDGTLTILDAKPHWEGESHGNIEMYMKEFETMAVKGIKMKKPTVIIGDITKTKLENRFDLIYEIGTFKCIVNLKATKLKSGSYIPPTIQILNAYHKMLKQNGVALIAYPDGIEDAGYSNLINILEHEERFRSKLENENYILSYELINVDKEKVRLNGRKTDYNDIYSSKIHLNENGRVIMGNKYRGVKIIRLEKN